MAISKFTPLNAKKDTGRTIGDNEVAKLANLNRMVDQVNAALAGGGGGGLGTLDVTTVGSVGQNVSIQYNFNSYISATATGAQHYEVVGVPNFTIYGNSNSDLSYIGLPTLKAINYFSLLFFPQLATISAAEATNIYNIQFTSLPLLNTLDFPKLVTLDTLNIGFDNSGNVIENLNFPLVETINRFNFSNAYYHLTNKINSTTFPVLTTAGFQIGTLYDLGEIVLPTVTKISNQGIQITTYNTSFTKFSLPNIVRSETTYISIQNNPALTSLIIGTVGVTKSFPTSGSPNIYLQNNALNQASVDNILSVLASLDGTNGTTASYSGQIYLNGGSNASPSSIGYAAISILQGRGWYVATN